MKNRVIFLDTNIFESAKFSYESDNFLRFLEICKEKSLKLCITDVVQKEVYKRIHFNIKEELERVNKNFIKLILSNLDVSVESKVKLTEKLVEKITSDFDNFLSDYDVEVIKSNFDQSLLIDSYFGIKSPFSEQKKEEFPDAIILLTIKKYREDKGVDVYIASNDSEFQEFCDENKIDLYSKLSDLTHKLNMEDPNQELKELYEKHLDDIKNEIGKSVKSQDDFILYSYDSIDEVYVDNIKVQDVLVNKLDVIQFDTDENSIQLEVDISIEFSANASYPDEDTMIHDKEDGVYYYGMKNNATIETTQKTTCIVAVSFFDDDTFSADEIDIQDKEFEFSLDDRTIVKLEQDENFGSFKW